MPVNVCKFDRQRICREPKLNQDAGSVGGHPPDDGTDGTTLLLNRKNRRHLRPFVGDCEARLKLACYMELKQLCTELQRLMFEPSPLL